MPKFEKGEKNPMFGRKHTEEFKEKVRAYKHTPEAIEKIRLAGKRKMSIKVAEALKKANTGAKRSDEAKLKMSLSHKGIKLSKEHTEKIRQFKIGKPLKEETKKKISIANMGKKQSEEAIKKIKIARAKQVFTAETRKKLSELRKGEKHHNWKGGVTPINETIRKSFEYKLWRKAVFERDNYQCIWCGKGGDIHADHIKPFAYYPELRFAIDNGRTLCVECHKSTDTYGHRAKNHEKTRS